MPAVFPSKMMVGRPEIVAKIEKDSHTGVETTGHEWDGIKELNTPLPRWWLYVLYATIVWSAIYCVFYPSWPSLSGYFVGTTGWTSRGELDETMEAAKRQHAPLVAKIKATPLEAILANKDMRDYAFAAGQAVFRVNCVQCHGAGGQGNPGFPSLADDKWLWGGKLADISQTIQHGIRATNDDETRQGEMPAWGTKDAPVQLTSAQIDDTAEFVLSLSGASKDAVAAGRGKTVFAENCVACHGESAQGNPDMGAPNLADGLWLYGGSKATVVDSITHGRKGLMPAWSKRLDEATIKELVVYVHGLGGGK